MAGLVVRSGIRRSKAFGGTRALPVGGCRAVDIRRARDARHVVDMQAHARNIAARLRQGPAHDDGVFAVAVIMGTRADDAQPHAFVKRLGARIRGARCV